MAATHSSILAWRIPWTEKPVGLQSMGLQRWTRLSNSDTQKPLTQECLSEKAVIPYSNTLAWKIPWMKKPGGLKSMGSLRDMTERLHFHFSLPCIEEGTGNPLQCSCLENPRDGGAWWAAVSGVAQSRTRLKRLSSSSSSY